MRRDKDLERKIAKERISILMELAEKESSKGNQKRTERYVSLAKRIGTRYNVRFPRALKRRLCRHCDALLIPPLNCRVRLTRGKVTIYCFKCQKFTRIPYIREKKEKLRKGKAAEGILGASGSAR